MATSDYNGYWQNMQNDRVKGVKLKSESFFSTSCGILELLRKTLGEGQIPTPCPDRVKLVHPLNT